MSLRIREADLGRDREELIGFLTENLHEASDESRFDWLYLANPHGEPRVQMAVDPGDRTVGVAAAFPRSLRVAGGQGIGWVLGDFCIAKTHRSLGPAVQLQRALFARLTQDENAICYDFPSPGMLSVYGRLAIAVLGRHIRHTKLLRTDSKVQQVIGQESVGRALSKVGNWVLQFQSATVLPDGIEFSIHHGPFEEEFAASAHVFEVRRDLEYLNWRYLKHPLKRYCAVVAKRGGRLLGSGVFEVTDTNATITDINAVEANIVSGILAYIEYIARDMNLHSINCAVLEGCHLMTHLRRAGFYAREAVPVVVHAAESSKWSAEIRLARNWLLLDGDRES